MGPILDRLVDCLEHALTLGEERDQALAAEEAELRAAESGVDELAQVAASLAGEAPEPHQPQPAVLTRRLSGSVTAAIRWDFALQEAEAMLGEVRSDPDLRDDADVLTHLIHAALMGRGEPMWSHVQEPTGLPSGTRLSEARPLTQRAETAETETAGEEVETEGFEELVRAYWADLARETPAELAALEERLHRWREKEAVKRAALERALDRARDLRQRYIG